MKLGRDTEMKVGLWLVGDCQWFPVDLIRGAGLVDPVLYFLLLQYFGDGEEERAGREESLNVHFGLLPIFFLNKKNLFIYFWLHWSSLLHAGFL